MYGYGSPEKCNGSRVTEFNLRSGEKSSCCAIEGMQSDVDAQLEQTGEEEIGRELTKELSGTESSLEDSREKNDNSFIWLQKFQRESKK
jgi:hypothetical protein